MVRKPRKLKARKHQIAKSKRSNKKSSGPRDAVRPSAKESLPVIFSKPNNFDKLSDVVDYASHHTYSITRLRKMGVGTRPVTLGSGFLVGPNRIFTCAHVLNNDEDPSKKLAQHEDGDAYLFIQKRDGEFHSHAVKNLILNEEIFLYPKIDAAIIYLPDDFYKLDGKFIKNPKNHLLFSEHQSPIGVDVGVLGYPMQHVRFSATGQLDPSSVIMRTDKGVINTRYVATSDNVHMYEFTIAFNPGNSGGPILEQDTGKVIGWVQGFNPFPIPLKNGKEIWNAYSRGCSSENLKPYTEQHSIYFSK